MGAALFLLVSKYGFTAVLAEGRVVLDPSRMAAQIVSGIGFIGGGLIFVRRDVVRGLTTRSGYSVEQALTARRDSDRVIDLQMRLLGPPGVSNPLVTLGEQHGILAVETGGIDDATE